MIKDDSIVLKLTPEELLVLEDFAKLAREAIEAAELISKKYTFAEGQDKIIIWGDENDTCEFITNDYIWYENYAHEQYVVSCTAKDIYELYRNEFLYHEQYSDSYFYRKQAIIAKNFREFVEDAKKKE